MKDIKPAEKTLILAIIISSFALGTISGNIVDPKVANSKFDNAKIPKISSEDSQQSIHEPKYGTAHIISQPDGPIYQLLKPNISTLVDDWGTPPYRVETNSKGLRDEEFEKQKPGDVTRILILGDSYAFGWGANRSERFTELLEQKLEANSSREYELINAGVPGYGMKDMYLYLENRGLNYNPDAVIVSFGPNDWISRSQWDKTIRESHRRVFSRVNKSEISDKKLRNLIAQEEGRLRRRIFKDRNLTKLDTFIYMSRMEELSKSEEFKLIFSSYSSFTWMPFSEKTRKSIVKWKKNHSSKVIWAPEEFKEMPKSKYTLSAVDPHYNARGHKLLAEHIYQNIDPKSLN